MNEAPVSIVAPAWTTHVFVAPSNTRMARGLSEKDRAIAASLAESGRVKMVELREGIQIETRSFVGIIPFDTFSLHITPRVSSTDMVRMIDYSFRAEASRMGDRYGSVAVDSVLPSDIVIAALLGEIRYLLRRGLVRQYVEYQDTVPFCRGRIQFNALVSQAGPAVALPCIYEDHTSNVLLNQVLLASAKLCCEEAVSPYLRATAFRLVEQLGANCSFSIGGPIEYREIISGLTRLTKHYRPAIELSCLLHDSLIPDAEGSKARRFPAFLVDMNRVFERFVGGLLMEFSPPGIYVFPQDPIPTPYSTDGSLPPHPRPDFVLREENGGICRVLDAKYKFLDNRSIDIGDLYQLTIYGLAVGADRVVALYPGSGNRDSEYAFRGSCGARTSVISRAVNLSEIWRILDSPERSAEGRRLVERLIKV